MDNLTAYDKKFIKSLGPSHKEFYDCLCNIEKNPDKKIISDKFDEGEFIYYSAKRKEFLYEDGSFIGKSPLEIIYLTKNNSWFKWIETANFFVI